MMEFSQNELTLQVAQSAKDFALQYIKPHLMEWDEAQEFPVHIFKELGKLGMMGVLVPEAYGGTGLGYLEYSAVIQELTADNRSAGLSENSPVGRAAAAANGSTPAVKQLQGDASAPAGVA